jgi:hypothetical protein
MHLIRLCAAVSLIGCFGGSSSGEEPPKGEKVEFTQHANGYFEKNNAGLKGDLSTLAITDAKTFDSIFGIGRVMGPMPNFLPEDAFDKKMVVAVIKRGNAFYQYKVDSLTTSDDALYLKYTATGNGAGGTATFASPLILSLDKGKYKSVVFFEGDKKVGKVEIGK